jgi:hypothetical protein
MLTRNYLNRNPRSYEVIFQREGHEVETLYWTGPMEEVRELAGEIAFRGGADAFRIIECQWASNFDPDRRPGRGRVGEGPSFEVRRDS